MGRKTEGQERPGSGLGQVFNLEQEISVLEQEILSLERKIIDAKERLEKLQDELALTGQRKSEIEAQIKKILENAEKEKAAVLKEAEELKEKKKGLEEECADLSAKSAKMLHDADVKSKELQNLNDELEKARKQLDLAIHDKKRVFKKRAVAGLLLIFVLCVSVAVIRSGFNDEISELEGLYQDARAGKIEADARISELEDLCQEAKAGEEEALARLSEIKEYAGPVMIKVNNVYNAKTGGDKINDDLKVSEMRYLQFDFDISFLDDNVKEAEIYMDIYYPSGTLARAVNSPLGHTASFEAKGLQSIGWGNSDKSTYSSGTYRVDFVYEGKIIYSQKVVISD